MYTLQAIWGPLDIEGKQEERERGTVAVVNNPSPESKKESFHLSGSQIAAKKLSNCGQETEAAPGELVSSCRVHMISVREEGMLGVSGQLEIGPFGFQAYSMECEERQGLYRSSNGTFCQNIQMSDDHCSGVRKRKGIDDSIALLNPSASSSRMQNVGDQQTEVSSQPERISVEEGNQNSSSKMQSKEGSSDGDGTKEDYVHVHVQAKQGQATNSHSLAERLRRKKISERMKLLQDLVPGCSKAVMLDEIINYVQSLQRQVEFLSMKLATVNPELGFDIEQILSKQMMLSQHRHLALYGVDPESRTLAHFSQGIMPPEMMCNIPAMWEGFQNIHHMNFNPGATTDSGTNNAVSMKIE
ncbi:hypothetical protein GUJ93_ZPchr0172g2977 [Zizania palustris]|uniref:BHLH domain-containing protein n=1 Tax=Zizania palustris TaxID=103762 RepID=A0A8J5W6N3_ZIZPA|nr:hypothetical protein GUJ93_ZPchr0172g2977 [Zizania palustris]